MYFSTYLIKGYPVNLLAQFLAILSLVIKKQSVLTKTYNGSAANILARLTMPPMVQAAVEPTIVNNYAAQASTTATTSSSSSSSSLSTDDEFELALASVRNKLFSRNYDSTASDQQNTNGHSPAMTPVID